LGHQVLNSQARQLLKAGQVLKCGGEAGKAARGQEALQGNLDPGLVTHGAGLAGCLVIDSRIGLHLGFDIRFRNRLHGVGQFAEAVAVDLPAQADLGFPCRPR
jgi:hypothetical protein